MVPSNMDADMAESQICVAGDVKRRRTGLTSIQVAFLVLALGLGISYSFWRIANANQDREARSQFEASSNMALAGIQRRVDEFETLLLGMQGLFIASEQVDRREFQRYYNNLRGQLRITGIRAIHFTRRVLEGEKAAFISSVRNDKSLSAKGFPNFFIHPDSTQGEYFVIEYIEPFEANQPAFGLDALSQSVNRESFLAARDSGLVSFTQPFQLVQTARGERGMVLRAPVYRYGALMRTVEERRRAFVGLVGISLNATEIFRDVFATTFLEGLCIVVHDVSRDGSNETPAPLRQVIAENCHESHVKAPGSGLESTTIIPVGGRLWEIKLSAPEDWARKQHEYNPVLVAVGGIVISLLLALLYLALARSRTRAQQLADEMTRNLRQSERRFRCMAELSSDWFWEQDVEARFTDISGTGGRGSGPMPLSLDKVKGRTRWDISPAALTPAQWDAHRRQLAAREEFVLEYPVTNAEGQERWVEAHGAPRFSETGEFLGYHGTAHDVTVRNQAEREMARKTTVLQATLDNMSQGISVVDENLHMTAMNRRFCEILDFPEEMGRNGASFETFIRYNAERGDYGPCDVDAKVKEMLERAKAMQAHQFKRTRPNGRVIEVVGNPLPGGGFVTTYTDVTERELAEHGIRASEERLRRAELASGSGNWEFHLDSQVIIASEGAAKLYGIKESELDYACIRSVPLPEERSRLDVAMQGLIERGQPYDIEFKIRKVDTGEVRDIHSMAVFEPAERIVFGVIQDITARKQAEELLRKLSLAVEQSPESIVITNLSAEIEYVNESFVRVSGYGREELVGQNPRILKSGDTPPETYAAMWGALCEGRPWRGELHNRSKGGRTFIEFVIVTPIRQPDGRITHYVAIKEDITEKKRIGRELDQHRYHLEELVKSRTAQLAETTKAAEAANIAKSAFLANMSHEIRTPMNAILGMASLMKRAGVTPKQAERLDKIDTAGQHLLEIINAILDISKIEAGKFVIEETVVNLGEITSNVASILHDRAQEKHLKILIETRQVPDRLLGDSARLQQALLNYATNATKFTEKGSITLRTRIDDESDTSVLVRFEVQDTGIGIDPETISRLFNTFEQADNSTTRKYGGTGLGLAITKRLAGLMGGAAGVDSVPGAGSTFWFTARLKKAAPAVVAGSSPIFGVGAEAALKRDFTGRRILLVEDDPGNREVALALLEEAGLVIDTAEDGDVAVEMAARGGYALILMDMQMPAMGGVEATRLIRASATGRHTPIVAMTANAFAEDRARCFEAGMNDFIAKPFSPDKLFSMIVKWLAQDKR
jgi:PAS domain S-box-containing protein